MANLFKASILVITLVTILANEVLLGQTAEKKSIAVLTLGTNKALTDQEASALTNRLRFNLVQTNHFDVMELDKMVGILEDAGLKETGCYSLECALMIAKVLNVQEIITGTIDKFGETYTINILVFSTDTAQAKQYLFDHEGEVDRLLNLTESVANNLAGIQGKESTKAIQFQEDLRKGGEVGFLTAKDVPRSAEIYIDGRRLEIDSLKQYELEVGKHEVRLNHSRSMRESIIIEANKEKVIRARFCPTISQTSTLDSVLTYLTYRIILPGLNETLYGSKIKGGGRLLGVDGLRSLFLYRLYDNNKKLENYNSTRADYRASARMGNNILSTLLGLEMEAKFSASDEAFKRLYWASAAWVIVEIANLVLCNDDIQIDTVDNERRILHKTSFSRGGIYFGLQLQL